MALETISSNPHVKTSIPNQYSCPDILQPQAIEPLLPKQTMPKMPKQFSVLAITRPSIDITIHKFDKLEGKIAQEPTLRRGNKLLNGNQLRFHPHTALVREQPLSYTRIKTFIASMYPTLQQPPCLTEGMQPKSRVHAFETHTRDIRDCSVRLA
jgi:hypothetical protein